MAGQSEEAAVTESIHVRRLQGYKQSTAQRIIEQATREGVAVADLSAIRLPWYRIDNRADEPEQPATVWIYDEVGGSFGVEAAQFAKDLQEITASEIRVRVNSPGGSVFDGVAIYNSLNHHPAKVTVYVDSLAASIASVIAMAGDEIVMMPGSQMMIHDALGVERGQAADMAKMSTFLDRQSDNIAEIYCRRAGGDIAEWRELMLGETWMFAREAVQFGLADRTLDDAEREPDPPMTRTFDLGQFRYAGRQAAPSPQRRRQTSAQPKLRRADSAPILARMSSDAERRDAARARVAAFEGKSGRSTARRVAPAGVSGARMAAFPARLRAELVEHNGQRRYHLHGHASVTDTPYEMWDTFGPYMEVIERGAFTNTLASSPDVAFLVNHRGVTMARTTNDSLRLRMDDTGLEVDAWLNPKRQDVSDLVVAIEDEDVTEMSFAFMLEDGGGTWDQNFEEFRITELDIDRGDVSAVNYGANPYTDVAARSREVLADLDRLPAGAARAAVTRLQARSDLAPTTIEATQRRVDAAPERVPAGRGRSLVHIEALLDET
jgi:HK97 family phage prohead protease/ATP-dependent Clp endopeptidase proteolytic subunit ClpP